MTATGSHSFDRRTVVRALVASTALAVSPALMGCRSATTSKPATGLSGSPGRLVMVIRHAEKPVKTGGGPTGIDLRGLADSHSLTERGWSRAAALYDLFGPNPATGLPQPGFIYASGNGGGGADEDEGTRSRETVGPLAAALDLPINTSYSRGEEGALATDAARQPAPVLICWQHDAIPAIAAAFAPTPGPPSNWPGDRFDLVWVFTASATGWRFQQVPQQLLPDDTTTGIS